MTVRVVGCVSQLPCYGGIPRGETLSGDVSGEFLDGSELTVFFQDQVIAGDQYQRLCVTSADRDDLMAS